MPDAEDRPTDPDTKPTPTPTPTPAPVTDLPLVEFPDVVAWEAWLEQHHAASNGIWMMLAKKGSPRATVTQAQALETALCFGWIDGQVGRLDEHFYRQRYTPRRTRSKWSQINRASALVLIERGMMRPAGLAEVHRAQADGRWEAAYEPQARATVPDDFAVALEQRPEAAEFFATLTGVRRYAFLYRIADAKRPETRARRIRDYVALLAERRTLN
jgi:uncharacterized protein YdeI (YjbR/CyaY-like superfamily)